VHALLGGFHFIKQYIALNEVIQSRLSKRKYYSIVKGITSRYPC
jgi:hypothetical protein